MEKVVDFGVETFCSASTQTFYIWLDEQKQGSVNNDNGGWSTIT